MNDFQKIKIPLSLQKYQMSTNVVKNLIRLFSIGQINLIIKNKPILSTKMMIILLILNIQRSPAQKIQKDQNQNFQCYKSK